MYAGVAIVAAWVVGLTLFSARQMGVNLLSTLLFNSLLLMGAYAGPIPYAPFFNTTAASIGQINPGLLRPMNAITMLLLGVVLAIVYFIVARWKQREAELLAVARPWARPMPSSVDMWQCSWPMKCAMATTRHLSVTNVVN